MDMRSVEMHSLINRLMYSTSYGHDLIDSISIRRRLVNLPPNIDPKDNDFLSELMKKTNMDKASLILKAASDLFDLKMYLVNFIKEYDDSNGVSSEDKEFVDMLIQKMRDYSEEVFKDDPFIS